jgi:hypothetical protein
MRACSMGIDTQHGLGHVAWTWAHGIDLDMQNVQAQAACLSSNWGSCPYCKSMSMLRVYVHAVTMSMLLDHFHVHSASPCLCCMSRPISMLHVHVHAACQCPCCMSMTMPLYVHVHVHAHAACSGPWCMVMEMQQRHRHAVWTCACSMDMGTPHGNWHVAWTYDQACPIYLVHKSANFLLVCTFSRLAEEGS